VEITVTLANESRFAPTFEERRTPFDLATGVVGHSVRRRWIQTRSPELGESGSVAFGDPRHARGAPTIPAVLGGAVESGDRSSQRGHEINAED